MKRTDNQKTGWLGETIACLYLMLHGYRILERNFRYGNDELDIIACTYGTLAFVEVKTRRYPGANWQDYPRPRDAVDRVKRDATLRAKKYYLALHPTNKTVSMDIFELILDSDCKFPKILYQKHIKNAYRGEL